jgi:hypothetical protein
MRENLNFGQSDQILAACKAMGLDAVIVIDKNAVVTHDVAKAAE